MHRYGDAYTRTMTTTHSTNELWSWTVNFELEVTHECSELVVLPSTYFRIPDTDGRRDLEDTHTVRSSKNNDTNIHV